MIPRNRSALVLAALLLGSGPVGAQVVRGTVTERGSGEPLSGVLVSLEPADPAGGGAAVSVLSDIAGTYAVRGTVGQFRVVAKRIGVQRFSSEPFALAAGETRELDIVMEAAVFQLPAVRIVDATLCTSRDADGQRVAALWDEARTALTAASISRRDRLFQGSITRYTRTLDPRDLRIFTDRWSEIAGTYDRTFSGPSGDSLSALGYWHIRNGIAHYYAPDGDVLLSRAFQRDHCFSTAQRRDRPGLVGLGFVPRADRPKPDVRGTLWMDERTFDLRFVEFTYTRLPDAPNAERVGGEIHFARLANGAWVTSRWFLRMPEYVEGTDVSAPILMTRPTIRTLIEEGGMAFGPGLRLFTTPATVLGALLDSAGRPFEGGTVRLAGTPFRTQSRADGSFRIDSLPAGHFTLVAEHESYSASGGTMADEGIDLREGIDSRVTLRGYSTVRLAERLCPGRRRQSGRSIVRLEAVDSLTSEPLRNLGVWLRWAGDFAGRGENLVAGNRGGEETRTDEQGVAVFCDAPANLALTISAVNGIGRPARDSIVVRPDGAAVLSARLRTGRP